MHHVQSHRFFSSPGKQTGFRKIENKAYETKEKIQYLGIPMELDGCRSWEEKLEKIPVETVKL